MRTMQQLKDETAGILEKKDFAGDVEEVIDAFMDVLEGYNGTIRFYHPPSRTKRTVEVGQAGEKSKASG